MCPAAQRCDNDGRCRPQSRADGPSPELDLRLPDLADPPDLGAPAGMVLVLGGTFLMGATTTMGAPGYDPEALPREQPVHQVTVASFFLDQLEVSVAKYQQCVASGSCTPPDTQSGCNWLVAGKENHPINCVAWGQAAAFCSWQMKRLPSEEEWEFAARGTQSSKYPWGNDAPLPQLCGNQAAGTCLGGLYERTLLGGRNAQGVADLAGNVWEWTRSTFCNYDGSGCTASHVLRGGSWFDKTGDWFRGARRIYYDGDVYLSNNGVRCARDAP